MRVSLMETPGVLQKAEERWREHPTWARDPRKKWALALGRLRQLATHGRAQQARRGGGRNDGETLTDDEDILKEVHCNYSRLYDKEPEGAEVRQLRQETLLLMDKTLTSE
ncbi:hypothetical protein R1sor_012141 [Riccia sorocarpa]|uniref:Uncharacterized protein n=1 Tax=Riccia sorocarpa TaxID=122646 RepID=A0ABD3I6J8_9MARC